MSSCYRGTTVVLKLNTDFSSLGTAQVLQRKHTLQLQSNVNKARCSVPMRLVVAQILVCLLWNLSSVYEIWKYRQSTSRVQPSVLQNLRVYRQWARLTCEGVAVPGMLQCLATISDSTRSTLAFISGTGWGETQPAQSEGSELSRCCSDVKDSAAEALQRQADVFRQKPLSAEEQEHVKRVDRIIMNVLSQVWTAFRLRSVPA